MKKRILFGLAVIMTVGILSGCGKVPQTQIDATNAAIEAAVLAEAPAYLPVEFAAVQDSMTSINAQVEAQKSKLFKKFGPVKEQLDATLAAANTVAANAVIKKEEVRVETETMITDVKTLLDENSKLINNAPKGKEGRAVLSEMRNELSVISTSVDEAQVMYDSTKYMDAYNKVKAAKESAIGINTELKDAISKVRR